VLVAAEADLRHLVSVLPYLHIGNNVPGMPRELVLVTGFNRGFGESITKLLISKKQQLLKDNQVDFVLISRVACAVDHFLEASREETIKLTNWQVDFSEARDLNKLSLLIKGLDESYERISLFSNAGALGKLDFTVDIGLDSIENATRVNYFGPVCLVTGIMNKFLSSTTTTIRLVNISSLAAIQPFKGWSTYCSTKAAASLFFKCIATEQDAKRVKVCTPCLFFKTNYLHEYRYSITLQGH
jgi:short-subunit dehydrogenase